MSVALFYTSFHKESEAQLRKSSAFCCIPEALELLEKQQAVVTLLHRVPVLPYVQILGAHFKKPSGEFGVKEIQHNGVTVSQNC